MLGALSTGVAVTGLLVSFGAFDRLTDWVDGSGPVLNQAADRSLGSNAVLFQFAALTFGVLLVLAGATWLRRQVPPIRRHQSQTFANTSDDVDGTNTVDGGALATALAADLERHPAIERATVEVSADDGVVRLQISVADTLSLSDLQTSVITPAVQLASIVGEFEPPLSCQTDVRFVEPERSIA
jgi:hypothetical protein